MSLFVAWVAFPLALAVIAAGWGMIAQLAAGTDVAGALLLPLGLAAALVVAGTLTAFSATAPAAVPVVAAGAVVGLALGWPGRPLDRLRARRRVPRRGPVHISWRLALWPALAAVGALLVYGAPVLLSGQATFTGYIKLDDTATWFNVVDHVMSHARSVRGELPSTYTLVYTGDIGPNYPLGAFMLPGVGRAVVDMDIAWVFQPYLACCGAAIALCLYGLVAPLVSSARLRALIAFGAAQPALLYGYSLWGGIKELTAAFLLALGVALAAALLSRRPARPRELIPLAIATGALIQTLGPGAAGWVAPALVAIVAAWGWLVPRRERDAERASAQRGRARWRPITGSLAWLVALTAACVVPVWVVLSSFLSGKSGQKNLSLFEQLFSSGQSAAVKLGNLVHPLSVFQLGGIWPVHDFRVTAPAASTAPLLALLALAAAGALWAAARGREFGPALYLIVALCGAGILYFAGATPWVTGKAMAIGSPALLTAALCGAGMLWGAHAGHRVLGAAGALVAVVLVGGVLWSNVLAYGDVTLAPRKRMVELEHIGELIAGKGPTFINEYEIYAARHFLRAGAPVEPAEYRYSNLPLADGTILTKAAAADLDAFSLSTLDPYRSIVTRRSPAESRPPSIYRLVWQGRYYQLWERSAATHANVEHVALGESQTLPYCGHAQDDPLKPLCSADPVATPPCAQVQALARRAAQTHGSLLAYARPAPIVARGDETLWPGVWFHDDAEHSIWPTAPGKAVSHIAVASAQTYELWLGGSFERGFEVRVDGKPAGRVKDQLSTIDGYIHLADVFLTPGVHTFSLSYPAANLTPGSAGRGLTSLQAIVLQPRTPRSALVRVAPGQASALCGRSLDWIEVVTSS